MDKVSTIILAASLIIIMFGMGLSLVLEDFRQVFVKPKAMFAGLTSQLILLPIIGFILIKFIPAPPEILIGIVILVACPGGSTSNMITYLAKGDTALSVSLTAICSFITLFTIPFLINFGIREILGSDTDRQLNILSTIAQVFVVVIIPVTLGMLTRAKKELFAKKVEPIVRRASVIVFVLIFVGIIMAERKNVIPYFQKAGVLALILNVSAMSIGLGLGKILNLSIKQRISIAIESGIQNGTLAISIATLLLANTSYGIVAAVYSLVMFVTCGIFILFCRQIKES